MLACLNYYLTNNLHPSITTIVHNCYKNNTNHHKLKLTAKISNVASPFI